MLTADEIDAVALGAHWVAGHADPALARAARDVLAKIENVLPEELRPFIADPTTRTAPAWDRYEDGIDAAQLRAQIRASRKLRIDYADEHGAVTERTVWPLMIGYLDARRILIGWCELRGDYRSFRLDRIRDAAFLDDPIPGRPAQMRAEWLRRVRHEAAATSRT
jgi:predicted DNA-binding transcriptional regulator YafY